MKQDARDDVDQTWEMIKEVGEFERHFSQLEHQYRILASTWLLVVFVATGFVLTTEFDFLISTELLIASIAFVGAVGITLLWNLDLMVYHRLLDAHFYAGVELEQTNSWLPQTRNDMLQMLDDRGVLPHVVWFYIVSNTVVLLLGGSFLAAWFYSRAGAPLGAYATIVLTLLVTGIWGWLLWRSTLSEHLDKHQ